MVDTGYITKESALSCFSDWIDRYGHEHTADEMVEYQRIEELPEENVRSVVMGTWEDINLGWAQCTNCKLFVIGSREKSQYRFCPNCGAEMMEETDGRKD